MGRRSDTGTIVVRIDHRYFRPAEVETLLGDPTNAREKLGWTPTTTLEELVNEMIAVDQEEARKEAHLKRTGFEVVGPRDYRRLGHAPDPAKRSFVCGRGPRHGRQRHRSGAKRSGYGDPAMGSYSILVDGKSIYEAAVNHWMTSKSSPAKRLGATVGESVSKPPRVPLRTYN